MRIIYLYRNWRKNNGSLLVGSVSCASIMLMCLLLITTNMYNNLYFLSLEKDYRIGKIMIHTVWQSIKNEPDKQQNDYQFNVGTVYIERGQSSITLKSQLHSGVSVQQVFTLPTSSEMKDK